MVVSVSLVEGHFYFLDDSYFDEFADKNLMRSDERPCFCAFQEQKTGLFWMVPISSRVLKYKKVYDDKISRFGKCYTIVFGKVLGYEKAFLIQNMCPVTSEYVREEYFHHDKPVKLELSVQKMILENAKRVLAMLRGRQMTNLILPNVLEIEKKL